VKTFWFTQLSLNIFVCDPIMLAKILFWSLQFGVTVNLVFTF